MDFCRSLLFLLTNTTAAKIIFMFTIFTVLLRRLEAPEVHLKVCITLYQALSLYPLVELLGLVMMFLGRDSRNGAKCLHAAPYSQW